MSRLSSLHFQELPDVVKAPAQCTKRARGTRFLASCFIQSEYLTFVRLCLVPFFCLSLSLHLSLPPGVQGQRPASPEDLSVEVSASILGRMLPDLEVLDSETVSALNKLWTADFKRVCVEEQTHNRTVDSEKEDTSLT